MLLSEFFARVLAPCRRIFHAVVTVTFAYYSKKTNYLKENLITRILANFLTSVFNGDPDPEPAF
jgi:hypothetical protein